MQFNPSLPIGKNSKYFSHRPVRYNEDIYNDNNEFEKTDEKRGYWCDNIKQLIRKEDISDEDKIKYKIVKSDYSQNDTTNLRQQALFNFFIDNQIDDFENNWAKFTDAEQSELINFVWSKEKIQQLLTKNNVSDTFLSELKIYLLQKI